MKNLARVFSLLVSLIFFVYLSSLNFAVFDMAHHLFFANHYKNDWFSMVDQHVGGDLDMSTYPPLAYQMMAVLSFVFPLEASYYILLLASWLALSYFSSKLFSVYLKVDERKFWLMFLFVFFSTGALVTIFVFGQITTIVGLSFGFASLYWFVKFLKEDERQKGSMVGKIGRIGGISINLALSVLSLSLAAFSHNLSLFLTSIFYAFIILFEWRTVWKNIKILAASLLVFLILVSPVYYPSLSKAFTDSLVPGQEVLHWSRYPFASYLNFERWVSMYGLAIFMLSLPLMLLLSLSDAGNVESKKEYRAYLKIYAIALFFFLVGLARSTPLTLIFDGFEYWLTYERFSLVSSIILAALFPLFIPESSFTDLSYRGRKVNIIHIAIIVMFIAFSIEWLLWAHELFFTQPIGHPMAGRAEATSYVLGFLNSKSAQLGSNVYRYQTFGYGRPIGDIYLYSKLPTLDTDYFTGRTVDWIRDSGVDEIDQAKDRDFLDTFMGNADRYSVKYIITFSDFYHQFMRMQDWELVEERSFDGTSVIIWQNPNRIAEVQTIQENVTVVNYAWGIVPPAAALVFLLSLAYKLTYDRKVLE